jgi:hypothetical protein
MNVGCRTPDIACAHNTGLRANPLRNGGSGQRTRRFRSAEPGSSGQRSRAVPADAREFYATPQTPAESHHGRSPGPRPRTAHGKVQPDPGADVQPDIEFSPMFRSPGPRPDARSYANGLGDLSGRGQVTGGRGGSADISYLAARFCGDPLLAVLTSATPCCPCAPSHDSPAIVRPPATGSPATRQSGHPPARALGSTRPFRRPPQPLANV